MSDTHLRLRLEGGKTIEVCGPADITKETTEAVVNAANSSLLGGGGVDGAIHRAGGPSILHECERIVAEIGRLPAGKAVLTTGGKLTAKYVIHTVGPVYRDGRNREAEILASCYRKSIEVAEDHSITSISFPAISTGAYGYPLEKAASVAIKATLEALNSASQLKQVRFVLFDARGVSTYVTAVEKLQKAGAISPEMIESNS